MQSRILRRREVERLTLLSKASIYRQMQLGTFPIPLKLGRRAVAWRADEIHEWIASRPRATGDVPLRGHCSATALGVSLYPESRVAKMDLSTATIENSSLVLIRLMLSPVTLQWSISCPAKQLSSRIYTDAVSETGLEPTYTLAIGHAAKCGAQTLAPVRAVRVLT